MSKFIAILIAITFVVKSADGQNSTQIGFTNQTISESTNATSITVAPLDINATTTEIFQNISSTEINTTLAPDFLTITTTTTEIPSTAGFIPILDSGNDTSTLHNNTNITTIDLFANNTDNGTLIIPETEEDCNELCESRKKNIVLAVSLSVFGGLILIGVFAYMALYKRKSRIRYGYGSVSKPTSGYTQVPPSADDYMEPIPVPKTLGVEKV